MAAPPPGPAMGAASLAVARRAAGRHLIVRNATVRRIVAAGLVSGLGDRLTTVALATLVLALTGSIAQTSLVYAASAAPYVLFGLVAGALVDRWDRRASMVRADLARAVLVLCIPWAAGVDAPLVYALVFGVTCARIVFVPSQQAIVPELVAPGDLTAANSLVRAAQYFTDLIGYPIAAGLVAVLVERLGPVQGTGVAFGLDALSFVGSAAILRRLRTSAGPAEVRPRPERSLRREVATGVRFLLSHRYVRANTVLLTLAPLLLASMNTLWIGFAWRVSHTDAFGFGVINSAMAAGVLLGTWLLQRATERVNKGRLILGSVALFGVAVLLAGTTTSLWLAALLAGVTGVANIGFLVPSVTLVQQQTPPELRGRVLGVRLMLTYAAFAVSNAAAGALSDRLGVETLMLWVGAATIAMAGWAYALPSLREAS
ncbi:MAG TPA: MFS transporter [Chloroflexota bacterium]|nr:MFS transporter [Chloroflexota bacterium]